MSDSTLGILIIIFFVIMGIFSGGSIFRPAVEVATSSPQSTIGSEYYYPDTEDDYARADAQRQLRLISADVVDLNQEVQRRIEEQNASIYKGKVGISGIYNVGSFNEYAVISIQNEPGGSVILSGWKIKSLVTGGELVIGGASTIPEIGLPKDAPIIISEPYAKVIVSHALSPLNSSFRVNICTGYLDRNDSFLPSLPRECPKPSEEAPGVSREINNECLDYIDTLPRCNIPREREYPEPLTRTCEAYIETNINYETCVEKHQFDIDFLLPEWRVFSKARGILWLDRRDVIQLIDNAGKVVDTYDFN